MRFFITLAGQLDHLGVVMSSVSVTAKGQVTLKRDLLQHLGVRPGERIDIEKLPGGELRVRATRPTGTINGFLGVLAGKTNTVATIEEMNEAAAARWAGDK
jgi:antitoxin PrlF